MTQDQEERTKISCKNVPLDFFRDKNIAKEYFRKFGRLKRIIFKPKNLCCSVEYLSPKGASAAVENGGCYKDKYFGIELELPPVKRKRVSERDSDPDWSDDPEIKAELEAMGGTSDVKREYNLRPEAMVVDVMPEKTTSKSRKSWTLKETIKPLKKRTRLSRSSLTSEMVDLISLIKQQAHSDEDKFKILDARDKLLRMIMKQRHAKKEGPTIGTCPDMCPEKERLMRVTQHQVSLYEQSSGKGMDPKLAIKQYSRSSADQEMPLPHELRPVAVLKMTMSYLIHNIMDLSEMADVNLAEWFHFLWDRTRAIRKDITQQELGCKNSAALVEQCARFHIHCSARLVAEDPSVFDQKINTENLTKCLQTLKYMYHDLALQGKSCPNEAEFRAYIILLNLNDGNFMWEVQQLQEEIQKSKEIKFALSVYSALDKNNYIKFFKLVKQTTYLNSCILMRYFTQVRTKALKTFLKCYASRVKISYPLDEMTDNLGFDNVNSTAEFVECHGLQTNNERTHVMLDRQMFSIPEYPYMLDRSLNVVESKRTSTVGKIICGGVLPPKYYEQHEPLSSFNESGYLNLYEHFTEEEIKVTATNVTKERVSLEKSETELPDLFKKSTPTTPAETASKSTTNSTTFNQKMDVFQQSTPTSSIFSSPTNIFVSSEKMRPAPQKENIFASAKPKSPNVFGHKKTDPQDAALSKPDSTNVFSQIKPEPKRIFGQSGSKTTSIFQQKFVTSSSAGSIFGNQQKPSKNVFPASNVYDFKEDEPNSSKLSWTPSAPIGLETKQEFEKRKASVADIFFSGGKAFDDNIAKNSAQDKQLEEFSKKQQEERRQIEEGRRLLEIKKQEEQKERERQLKEEERLRENEKRKLEELEQRRKEDFERRKREEFEKRKKEEERERLAEEQKRKEEERIKELQRKQEQLRELERRKELEIRKSVAELMPDLLHKVDEIVKHDVLRKISQQISKRKLNRAFTSWKTFVQNNKNKRKLLDCSPLWVSFRNVKEEAQELKTNSQDLTLQNMKRYKLGEPYNFQIVENDNITRINLQLLSGILVKRYCVLNLTFFRNIYFKTTISIPNEEEMTEGLTRIENTLTKFIPWRHNSFLERVDINCAQKAYFCLEKKRGNKFDKFDSNGFIFIAANFNDSLCLRIVDSLKNFGIFVQIPIVLILQEPPENTQNLEILMKEEIISSYRIIIGNFAPSKLREFINEALIFLAANVEKPPSLQLDTLKSFLYKYLCTEIWKKANSFAKWNSNYKAALKNPNVVISLYNEALEKIRELILNKANFEYATFPGDFYDILPSQIPDSLPCDYRYFPLFCKEKRYYDLLDNTLKSFKLPHVKSWPPKDEIDLKTTIFDYCAEIVPTSDKLFYKVLAVLLKNITDEDRLCDIKDVLWTDIIQILALEKLECTDFILNKSLANKSAFDQLVVIYEPEQLTSFRNSDWFYVCSPIVQPYVCKFDVPAEKNEDQETEDDVNMEDLDALLSKIDRDVGKTIYTETLKEDWKRINSLVDDLEETIVIHKKISSKIGNKLKSIIEDS